MASIDDIKKAVRIILDHNDVTSALSGLADVDTLQIDSIIESQIVPAARMAELSAPKVLADWKELDDEWGTLDADNNVYTLELPSNFIRFGRAKMSSWPYGVSDFATTDEERYMRQWGEFAGLKATTRRPMAAIVEADDSECHSTLQLFGVEDEDTLDYCTVVVVPEITNSNLVIGAKLLHPFEYMCAALVAEVLKDTSKSNELMAIAKNLMITAEDASEATVVPEPQYVQQ